MSASIQIREAAVDDAEGIARVRVHTWRTAYAGIVPDACLAALDEDLKATNLREWLAERPHGASIFVADREDGHVGPKLFRTRAQEPNSPLQGMVRNHFGPTVVGFVTGGRERGINTAFDGELWAMYVLLEHQRQGIGRRLLNALAARLFDQGRRAMIVWSLAENPYRRFYETLGGTPAGEETIEIGGKCLIETAYGWPDIRTLVPSGSHEK